MLVLERSRQLLPLLLLLLPHNSQGMDGCQGKISSGVHAGENYWMRDYWKCGDVCTHYKSQCSCVGEKLNHDDTKWCCGGTKCTSGTCSKWMRGYKEGSDPYYCTEWSPAICTTGVALNLNQVCNGSCNENVLDDKRNSMSSRSFVAACNNDNICVKEGEGFTHSLGTYRPTICTGDSSCEGELDWCREEKREEEECPTNLFGRNLFTRCLRISSTNKVGNGTKYIPGQCIELKKLRDGKENNCLDRSDEDPFQEAYNGTAKETIIDFAKLRSCSDEDRGVGLECGEQKKCLPMFYWCAGAQESRDCSVPGGAVINTNDPTLCSNISFWRQQTCGQSGNKHVGIEDKLRCQAGFSGRCVEKRYWGIEGAKDQYGHNATCKDGSDLFRPIVKTEERDSQPSQTLIWKTKPLNEWNWNFYNNAEHLKEKAAKYVKDSRTGLWAIPESDPFKVPSVTEEDYKKGPEHRRNTYEKNFAEFYSSDNYVKDETTNLMMAPITEETCKAKEGFKCKVSFEA